MLKTITKNYRDRSTDSFFKFSFYCDRCGKEWTSEEYPFVHGFGEKLSEDEKRAKEILFRIDHDAAFERANLEARLRFNQCNSCGGFVCEALGQAKRLPCGKGGGPALRGPRQSPAQAGLVGRGGATA